MSNFRPIDLYFSYSTHFWIKPKNEAINKIIAFQCSLLILYILRQAVLSFRNQQEFQQNA